ncbi:hypothetical protein OAK75_01020 [Bacteriovoracales bacterium]|nr:hypothetical protein [Bacteriovoracales bacterium]
MGDNKNLITYLTHAVSFKGGDVANENLVFLVGSYCSLWEKELQKNNISQKDILERKPHFLDFIKTHYQTSKKVVY